MPQLDFIGIAVLTEECPLNANSTDGQMAWGGCQLCACPKYIDPGTALGICQRPGCGHRDIDHSFS
jgi:hypothetical protein